MHSHAIHSGPTNGRSTSTGMSTLRCTRPFPNGASAPRPPPVAYRRVFTALPVLDDTIRRRDDGGDDHGRRRRAEPAPEATHGSAACTTPPPTRGKCEPSGVAKKMAATAATAKSGRGVPWPSSHTKPVQMNGLGGGGNPQPRGRGWGNKTSGVGADASPVGRCAGMGSHRSAERVAGWGRGCTTRRPRRVPPRRPLLTPSKLPLMMCL